MKSESSDDRMSEGMRALYFTPVIVRRPMRKNASFASRPPREGRPARPGLDFSLAHVTAAQIALASDSVEPTTRQLTLEGAGSKLIDVYGGIRMGVGIAHRNCPAGCSGRRRPAKIQA